jgi:hypothetical protein
MAEEGICPSEDEMEAEEEIGRLQGENRRLMAALEEIARITQAAITKAPETR